MWLHWSEYLLAQDEFYRWFQKMVVALEPPVELQLGLKEKQWQLSHAQVLLHNVDNQAVLLDRLLEEAGSLFNRIGDPSVDEDAQKKMKAEYDAVKARAQVGRGWLHFPPTTLLHAHGQSIFPFFHSPPSISLSPHPHSASWPVCSLPPCVCKPPFHSLLPAPSISLHSPISPTHLVPHSPVYRSLTNSPFCLFNHLAVHPTHLSPVKTSSHVVIVSIYFPAHHLLTVCYPSTCSSIQHPVTHRPVLYLPIHLSFLPLSPCPDLLRASYTCGRLVNVLKSDGLCCPSAPVTSLHPPSLLTTLLPRLFPSPPFIPSSHLLLFLLLPQSCPSSCFILATFWQWFTELLR